MSVFHLSTTLLFQECIDISRDVLRPGVPDTMPSLVSAFGAAALTSLQPLRHDGGYSRATLSCWQPSCYVSPDVTYQAGVAAPASTLKGVTSATRRAATVAAGDQDALHCIVMRHLSQASLPAAAGGVCSSGLVYAAAKKL